MSGDEDAVEERVYTVPLHRAWTTPIKKRAPRAMRILRGFVKRSMRADSVIISGEVNEELWGRGIEGLSRKIRVRAVRDRDNVVRVYLIRGE